MASAEVTPTHDAGTPPLGQPPKTIRPPAAPMKHGNWFRHRPRPDSESAQAAAIKVGIGAIIGGIVYALESHRFAIVIWVIAGLMGVVTLSSQRARSQVGHWFAVLGGAVGRALGVLLLTPLYLIGFTIVRGLGRLARRDPLHMRDTESQTFWLPADQDRRKVRHIRSLFATEALVPSRGSGVIWLTSIAALLITAEVVLRMLGFGNPVLYQPHPQAGYFPAPNQNVQRYGGDVLINQYGMRRGDFPLEKPPGTLRIFMIGDSTLFGGSFIDQPDVYARRLETSLNRQFGDHKVEVLNMAANGWGPFNELGYVNSYGAFNSDVAIICLPIGDIGRRLTTLEDVPYFSAEYPPRLALEEVLRHLNWRTRQWGRRQSVLATRDEQNEKGIAAYVELAQKLRSLGCEVMVEILPGRDAGTSDFVPEEQQKDVEKLSAALKEIGVPVSFPAGMFKGHGNVKNTFADNVHLSPLGHAIYAEYVEKRLRDVSSKYQQWAQQITSDPTAQATAAQ